MNTAELLTDFPLFSRLSPGKLIRIAELAATAWLPAGRRVFSEGQQAEGCWLIHEGRVALDLFVPGRGLVVVETLGAGDVLGWSWLVPPYRWHFGATAVEPVMATELDTAQLRALASADTDFGYELALAMFTMMLRRLQASRVRLLDLYRNPRDDR